MPWSTLAFLAFCKKHFYERLSGFKTRLIKCFKKCFHFYWRSLWQAAWETIEGRTRILRWFLPQISRVRARFSSFHARGCGIKNIPVHSFSVNGPYLWQYIYDSSAVNFFFDFLDDRRDSIIASRRLKSTN